MRRIAGEWRHALFGEETDEASVRAAIWLSSWLVCALFFAFAAFVTFFWGSATPQPQFGDDPATLTEFIVLGAALVIGALLIVHLSPVASIRATSFLLAFVAVFFLSGYQYLKNGSSRTFHYGPVALANSAQMTLDIGLVGFGLAALYSGRNRKRLPSPEDEGAA